MVAFSLPLQLLFFFATSDWHQRSGRRNNSSRSRNCRPTQNKSLGILLPIAPPDSPQRAASCVRDAPFNSHTSFFLGSCHIVFWGTPTRLSYEVPIECLKVDTIPRRLTRRLISTLYNTTPGRWRAPQSNTGSRDRRTTICKRLRSVSSRSAIFLTETLRLRTTCVLHRRPLSIRSPLVSLAHVGSEEAAHEVHLAGVSLPTVQTVFRLDSVRAGTCVVRCASQGRCWDNQ
jgi:hypothetical protein